MSYSIPILISRSTIRKLSREANVYPEGKRVFNLSRVYLILRVSEISTLRRNGIYSKSNYILNLIINEY